LIKGTFFPNIDKKTRADCKFRIALGKFGKSSIRLNAAVLGK